MLHDLSSLATSRFGVTVFARGIRFVLLHVFFRDYHFGALLVSAVALEVRTCIAKLSPLTELVVIRCRWICPACSTTPTGIPGAISA
jgi:hypothetical protein